MKISTFVSEVDVNDPRFPGRVVRLHIHEVDGGFIGINDDYCETVANYILNPYRGCQIVKLDEQGGDEAVDPPLEEDEVFGFLKILKAFEDTCNLLSVDSKNIILDGISKRTGLSRDRIDVLLGMAKETLDMAAMTEFTRVLKDGNTM